MKKLISIIVATIFMSCSSDSEEIQETNDCGCGIVTEVVDVSKQNLQWMYTVKNNCTGDFHTFESKYEILTVGMRTCN